MDKTQILNISIDNILKKDLLQRLKDQGGFVVTPNVDHLVKLQTDIDFLDVYHHADYRVCDSQILIYASRFLGQPLQEKISGSDFFPAFYSYYADDENISIFLLGAADGVADLARQRINNKVGREIIVDAYSPSFNFENDEQECEYIIDRIKRSRASVLAVGVGAPKQEKWIHKYRNRLDHVHIFLAIGATIDFEAGYIERAPQWMSEAGLEWLYRLSSEPKRLWRRYLLDSPPFFWKMFQQRLGIYNYHYPIGLLLQQADLLTRQQAERILSSLNKQRKQSSGEIRRFGDIVVEEGWLKQKTVDFFADEFYTLKSSPRRVKIGNYLQAAGLINDQDIDKALEEQQQLGRKFGETVVSLGLVKPKTVNFFLRSIK